MARTQEEINATLKTTFEWAKAQLTDEETKAINERCMAQAECYKKDLAVKKSGVKKSVRSPFTTNANYFVKRDDEGKVVLGPDKKVIVTGKFAIRAVASSKTAITTPEYHQNKAGKSIPFQEIKGTVLQEDHKKAAEFIYATVISWMCATGTQLKADNLSPVLGEGKFAPIEVNQKRDADGNLTDGYWVNINFKVITQTNDPKTEFQKCSFGSRVPGKTLNAETADALLKPTETNRGYIEIMPDVHINEGQENRCEFRAQRIVLIPSPAQSSYVSLDDIYAAQDAMDGYDTIEEPGEPVAPVVADVPVPEVTAESIAPLDSPLEPTDAAMEDLMSQLGLDL